MTFQPHHFPTPKRPLGEPAVAELNPKTPSATIRMRHRAATLIQKYSGPRWREAMRTKWLIDVVSHIDKDYRSYIMEQAAEIATLHQQLEQASGMQATAAQAAQHENEHLRARVDSLEHALRSAQGALLDMQNRVAASEVVLSDAEEAARAAAEECHQLQQAVAVLAEHDASSRKALANRAHVMREALVASRGRVRQAAEQSRRHRVEVSALLALQAKEAEKDREAITTALQSSMAAAETLANAAARLDVDRLKLELEAYKEPWQYMAGRQKSPTRNREVTKKLGLKQMSMNVPLPY
ncbi:hypothetical protein HYH03_015421 [Edaphochlamys debaryana]|uniref:Uncharacterized protein n=1 Tax=Edaphochlamys debaryana TaxID=47281 RepID=A0A835XKM4_9CHLO|nr:hypothetical protein HYH03_015421 [Edaphochlamys debaryana]|eukprot:KAG2485838.1 hypothetical protein HYH03_015421 [Edaphochlamys debaryana]